MFQPLDPLTPSVANPSVVRHFKQKNQKGAIEIAAAIDEAKESQALSLVSTILMSPDPSFDVVPLAFSHGLASHPQRDSSYTAPNLAFQEDFRLRDLPDEVSRARALPTEAIS